MAASVFQTGGGGYDYEHYIQSAFLTTMVLGGTVPIFPNGKITEMCFQCKNKGYITDDLFLEITNVTGTHKILSQIKYNIALTEKNKTFTEVINAFWKDFNNGDIFDKAKDKFFLIKSGLTNDDKNHINVILDWATTHKDEDDFFSEVERIDIKNQKLQIFSNLLKEANGDIALTKREVWEFLKCFKLLSYDFGSENSTDLTNILNLISLSKSKAATATPMEIWNSVLAVSTEYNRNGGSIDLKGLKAFDLFTYFDLSVTQDAYKSLQKLVDDGNFIVMPISNTVKGFHIDRNEIRQDVLRSINQHQVTFVTGTPGVGKSAIIKELLAIELSDSLPFLFKADQFNKSTLSQVFTEIGISHNLLDLISTISLLQNKIIIIDSGEKLLEGDPDNSFKQLLEIIRENTTLKILVTSRSYAVNVIAQKYSIPNLNLIEIPSLSDIELQSIAIKFPKINSLLNNNNIKEILRSPKYLEFALNAIDKAEFQSEDITLTEFKDKLWFQIIENGNVVKNGIARKREKTFNHIAIGRAVNMQLFFHPEDSAIDYEAVDALLNDNVISKNGIKYEFTPSHDILEDWALVRHISATNNFLASGEVLFDKLTNQPALRRAFRLWIEELILTDIDTVQELVRTTLTNSNIERYWVDEILTAIFRSGDCSAFFNSFKNELVEKNASFLNRCILICRTTCKEYSYKESSSKDILLPIGSAWEELLIFIAANYEDVKSIRNTILEFLLDWEYKYLFIFTACTAREIMAGKAIAINFIKEIEKQEEFWDGSSERNKFEDLIYLVFSFANYDEDEEIKNLLQRTLDRKKEEGNWGLEVYYDKVSELALGGVRNQKLIYRYPDLIIDLANKNWKKSPEKPKKSRDSLLFSFPESKERDESWGIKRYRFDFFPSGIYKTFVYNLLRSHPIKGLQFVVEFTNYMIKSYADSEYSKKEDLIQVEINLNSGEVVQEYSNDFLWLAYRGTVVTDYLLESILASFEKYMLEMANTKEADTILAFQLLVDYCLKNSNSVTLTSCLVSVFIAHPESFGKSILPILKCKECYELDLNRATRERSTMAILDERISYAQKERYDSNKLPHRTKYMRGLRDFMFIYQFNIGELNGEFFDILDGFYSTCGDDLLWEKAIYEMDSRKYKASKVENSRNMLQIEVEYPEKILSAVTTFTEERKYDDGSLSFSSKIHKVIEGTDSMTLEEWRATYSHYTQDENQRSMFDLPVSLAVIGLKNYPTELTAEQKQWSLNIIADTQLEIVKSKLDRMSFASLAYNSLEEKTTIEASHLLFTYIEDENKLDDCKITIAYLLISHLVDHEQNEYGTYFRTIFFEEQPQFSLKLWSFLISYSKFHTENKQRYFRTPEDEKAYHEKKYQFVSENILNNTITEEVIDFETHEAHYLAMALLLVNVETEDDRQRKFILKLTELILQDQKLKEEYSHNRSKQNRKLDTGIIIRVRFILNEILLYNEIEFCKTLLNTLIAPFLDENYATDRDTVDMYKFSQEILSTLITRYEDIVFLNIDSDIQKYGVHFWELWKELYQKIKLTGKNYFAKEMLLDSSWPIRSDNWKGFIDQKKFYEEIVLNFGSYNFPSVLKVFSTFGEKVFLPERLSWLVKFLEENPKNGQHLNSASAKTLIKVLFNNHISEIKNSQTLVSDFMYILNNMVEKGLSEAYLIRECVIIYKKNR